MLLYWNYLLSSAMAKKSFKNATRKLFFLTFFNKRNWNFEKHAYQNMVSMETSRHVDCDMSYQIVAR